MRCERKTMLSFESGSRSKDTGLKGRKDSEHKLQNINHNKTVPQF